MKIKKGIIILSLCMPLQNASYNKEILKIKKQEAKLNERFSDLSSRLACDAIVMIIGAAGSLFIATNDKRLSQIPFAIAGALTGATAAAGLLFLVRDSGKVMQSLCKQTALRAKFYALLPDDATAINGTPINTPDVQSNHTPNTNEQKTEA